MAKFNRFSSENILISIAGHLVLVAVLITSFAVVVNRAKMVAPDRIQIMEIDLNDIVVTGNETKLYNVGNVVESKPEEPTPVPDAKPDEKDEITENEPEEVKQLTLVEEPEKKQEEAQEEKKEDKKEQEKKK